VLDGSQIRASTGADVTVANPLVLRADTTVPDVVNVKMLLFTGPVTLEGGDRVWNQLATESTHFSGVISDGGNGLGFTITGTSGNQVVFGAANTYTGPTVLSGAGLHLESGASTSATSAFSMEGSSTTLSGTGAILGDAILLDGVVQPGTNLGADAGLLSFGGDLTLGNGTLEMQLDGLGRGVVGGYDALNVVGTLAYSGTLSLYISSLFNINDSLQLFDFSLASGSFSDIAFDGVYGSGSLVNQMDGTWLSADFKFIESTGTFMVVPEPGRATLLLLSLIATVGRRVRRHCLQGE
jgi:hypothetical protein